MPAVNLDVHAPLAGLDVSAQVCRQPARDIGGGQYARTTARAVNVRAFDGRTNKLRGGARAGLTKLTADRVAGVEWVVQELTTIVGTGFTPPGGQVPQPSQSGRVVTQVAVSQGNVKTRVSGSTGGWIAAVNATMETPPLNYSGIMFSSACNQLLFFADGTNYVYYTPSDNTVRQWIATAGTLPVDSGNNKPRLIATWRGCIVLAGLLLDPQNWFISRVRDPFNFDYAPPEPSQADAVAGNNARQGLIGDVVTGIIPYSDDILIWGGDGSIHEMRGDPRAGGEIVMRTNAIGMAWGQAWCQDPMGTIYFLSNRTGAYRYIPGQQPERITGPIENLLQTIDTGTYGVRLAWEDRFQAVVMFVTPLVAPGPTTHYAFEPRTGAWWPMKFKDSGMDPLCCCVSDGNDPNDRLLLLGCQDGYVRVLDPDAEDDDGQPIESEVWIGPLLTSYYDEVFVQELQGVLAEGSGTVTWAVHIGRTAEEALNSVAVKTGTWHELRNLTKGVNRAAHALYVKLTSSEVWALETIRLKLQPRATASEVRRRGH